MSNNIIPAGHILNRFNCHDTQVKPVNYSWNLWIENRKNMHCAIARSHCYDWKAFMGGHAMNMINYQTTFLKFENSKRNHFLLLENYVSAQLPLGQIEFHKQ